MSRSRTWVIGAIAVAFALAGAPLRAVPARAQGTDGFVAVDDLPARPTASHVVLFSLPDAFGACLPLTAACPADSSSLVVVPASGRRIVWLPEAAEVRAIAMSSEPLPAVGAPPGDAATARYHVPFVDGLGAGLVFAPRGLDAGRLTMGAPDAIDRGPYVPVLAGPSLGGSAPTGTEPERFVAEPVVVERDELDTDPVPVLVVRRAAPSRVAFGVMVDPSWRMETNIVPFLGDAGVAGLVRHEGRVRLAVALPEDVDADLVRRGTPRAENGNATPGSTAADDAGENAGEGTAGSAGIGLGALLAATGAVVAGAITALALRRRRKVHQS